MSDITLKKFSGSHYEIGVQQGKAIREIVDDALKRLLNLKFVKQMKPRLIPSFLFLTLAKHQAEKLLKKDIFQQYPNQAERLKGIADGARVSISTILFFQSGPSASLDKEYKKPSQFSAFPRATLLARSRGRLLA